MAFYIDQTSSIHYTTASPALSDLAKLTNAVGDHICEIYTSFAVSKRADETQASSNSNHTILTASGLGAIHLYFPNTSISSSNNYICIYGISPTGSSGYSGRFYFSYDSASKTVRVLLRLYYLADNGVLILTESTPGSGIVNYTSLFGFHVHNQNGDQTFAYAASGYGNRSLFSSSSVDYAGSGSVGNTEVDGPYLTFPPICPYGLDNSDSLFYCPCVLVDAYNSGMSSYTYAIQHIRWTVDKMFFCVNWGVAARGIFRMNDKYYLTVTDYCAIEIENVS